VSLQLFAQGLAIGVVNGILYVLTALGLTLIYGILHIVNFAHGEIYMLGAMGVYVLYVVYKLPLWLTLVAIAALALLAGFSVECAFFRRLRGQWLQLVVASVGISLIIQSVSWIVFGAQEKTVPTVVPGVLEAFGVRVPAERLTAAGVAILLVGALYWLVHRTKIGLAMRAMEEDEETARMLGVNANRIAGIAVGLGFVLAALGGMFVAPIYSINPGMGLDAILMCFIIVIIGGLGSITGTVLAGLLIGILQSLGALAFGAEAAHILIFVAMILVLVVRPSGLLGKA
jgi:branched-chain amino acid transport system permease protein